MKIINARCPLQDECGRKNVPINSGSWSVPTIGPMPAQRRRSPTRRPFGMISTTDYHYVIESALQDIAKSNRTERVKSLQADALSELKMRLNQYAGRCYVPALLCAIASKKSRWIMEAGTKNELNAILDPPAPRYDGNKFYPDRYMPPEEEAICWCETSLRAPLNEAGYKRYMEVFQQVFHKSVEDFLSEKE